MNIKSATTYWRSAELPRGTYDSLEEACAEGYCADDIHHVKLGPQDSHLDEIARARSSLRTHAARDARMLKLFDVSSGMVATGLGGGLLSTLTAAGGALCGQRTALMVGLVGLGASAACMSAGLWGEKKCGAARTMLRQEWAATHKQMDAWETGHVGEVGSIHTQRKLGSKMSYYFEKADPEDL